MWYKALSSVIIFLLHSRTTFSELSASYHLVPSFCSSRARSVRGNLFYLASVSSALIVSSVVETGNFSIKRAEMLQTSGVIYICTLMGAHKCRSPSDVPYTVSLSYRYHNIKLFCLCICLLVVHGRSAGLFPKTHTAFQKAYRGPGCQYTLSRRLDVILDDPFVQKQRHNVRRSHHRRL